MSKDVQKFFDETAKFSCRENNSRTEQEQARKDAEGNLWNEMAKPLERNGKRGQIKGEFKTEGRSCTVDYVLPCESVLMLCKVLLD